MATVIRNCTCPACGHERAEVREGKKGATSIYCQECGFQGLAKSPKASAALREGGARRKDAPGAPAAGAPAGAGAKGAADPFAKFVDGG